MSNPKIKVVWEFDTAEACQLGLGEPDKSLGEDYWQKVPKPYRIERNWDNFSESQMPLEEALTYLGNYCGFADHASYACLDYQHQSQIKRRIIKERKQRVRSKDIDWSLYCV